MNHLQYVVIKKEQFDSFISRLSKVQKVVAPISRGYKNFSFGEVTSAESIALKYIPTILPPKKFFLPQRETLLEFDTSKGLIAEAVVEYEKMTIFGVHTCDLAGIQCLNMVFSERPRDYNYLMHKRNINIMGLECNEYCDEYASCALVNAYLPNGGYDLFFTDLGDYFLVHINTQAGEDTIGAVKCSRPADEGHMEELSLLRERKRNIFRRELPIDYHDIPELFDRSKGSNVWTELKARCLGCGNCTAVCPTCYCYDIVDEMDLDLKRGRRYRRWDSCQLEPFARVAGGENFRKERSARQRHRYYRKFRYPVDKFSRFFCTGCGRCSRTCMAGIMLKETLEALIKESDLKIWKKWL